MSHSKIEEGKSAGNFIRSALRIRRRRHCAKALVSVAVLALTAASCGTAPASPTPAALRPSQTILTAEALASAISFRKRVGLRADEDWILEAASHPSAAAGFEAYGTPLTPAEKAELDARASNADDLAPLIASYGDQHPDEFAGAFVDVRTGQFVVLFTDSVDAHRAALDRRLRPGADLVVRDATWTLMELTARQGRVSADTAWLSSIEAWFEGTGIDIPANRVFLDLSSANPDAERLAVEHFNGAGWLHVQSDGIGRWDGPVGNVTIDAVTRSGQPARFLNCVLKPDDAAAVRSVGDYGTGDAGRCAITDIPATSYTVELEALPRDGSPWVVVGLARFVVQPLTTETVTVRVDLP